MSIFDSIKHKIEHDLNSLGDGIKHDLNSIRQRGPGCNQGC